MSNLIKIRELSVKYDVSARTLRYYEDEGLIKSTQSDDYAYRLYDEAAIKRLEQILILRRLNISIKDIKRIFSTTGSEVVLDVLGKKRLDFEKETDVKLLYDKAKDIETQISNTDYNGNSSIAERFFDVTEKLNNKVPDIMIVRITKFRAVTSGPMSYEDIFGKFELWQEAHNDFYQPIIFDAPDFLFDNNGNLEWI